MDLSTPRVLSLCSGIGGLELGLKLAIPGARLVGAVERDAYAAAILMARMEDQTLESAPIWDDLVTFDGSPWRGAVDIVTAGFPCQPISAAGKRAGTDDERWLWPEVLRVVRDVGPRIVFLENVPPLVTGGFIGGILGDLADLGFDVQWSMLAARDVGAPHLRKRVFILAYTRGLEPQRWGDAGDMVSAGADTESQTRQWQRGRDAASDSGAALVHADSERWDKRAGAADAERDAAKSADSGSILADPDSAGQPEFGIGGLPGDRDAPSRRYVDGYGGERLWPPSPDGTEGWERYGGPQPVIRRGPDGLPARMERLHALGNGVVPLVAAAAFRGLALRAEIIAPPR